MIYSEQLGKNNERNVEHSEFNSVSFDDKPLFDINISI